MITVLTLAALAAPPALADTIPEETDLAFRVHWGKVREPAESMWFELSPGFEVNSALSATAGSWFEKATEWLQHLQAVAEVDLTGKDVWITGAIDLDAKGDMVYCATFSGVKVAAPEPESLGEDIEARSYSGQDAWVEKETGLTWTVLDTKTLGVGNERGVQRLLRRRRQRQRPKTDIVIEAARLRGKEPVHVAFALPIETRRDVALAAGDVAALVGFAESGHLSADEKGFTLWATAPNKRDGATLLGGLRAAVGYAHGALGLIRGSAELQVGFDKIGRAPRSIPRGIDAALVDTFLEDWLRDFELDVAVRQRSGNVTEVQAKVSNYQGVMAIAAMAVALAQPESPSSATAKEVKGVLLALREAQRKHNAVTGSFLSCTPVPSTLPKIPVPWPTSSCFDRIAFRPPSPVIYQLEATMSEGQLILVARADPDGDGVPTVWLLDQTSDDIKTFGDP